MKRLTTLLLLIMTTVGFSSSIYGYEMEADTDTLQIGPFQITIDSMRSGGYCKDYVMHIVIRNTSDTVQYFNTDFIELVDKESGFTYYSISKDKESISVPSSMTGIITRASIKPNRAIPGYIWFVTPQGKADNKTKELYYNDTFCTAINELDKKAEEEEEKEEKKKRRRNRG